jgi:hypothetical protein
LGKIRYKFGGGGGWGEMEMINGIGGKEGWWVSCFKKRGRVKIRVEGLIIIGLKGC